MHSTDFTVGWICALPLELAASGGMLEEEYDATRVQKHPRDTNTYLLGQIAGHKIALTCQISAGNNQAGSTARHMSNTFHNLKFILMVGIGGGVPYPSPREDIRLGDVVVSMPSESYGGVIQYDAGRYLQDQDFKPTGALQAPPPDLQKTVKYLIAKHESEENHITRHINDMLKRKPNYTRARGDYRRPDRTRDILFKAEYVHEGDGDTCEQCDKSQLVKRKEHPEDESFIHYGNIASGSSVVRDALKREQLGKDYGAMCVEMESAGLMNEFRCLVIRGICDYSDSHKNKDWQRYAAAAAAAYAKELLGAVLPGPLVHIDDVQTSSSINSGSPSPPQTHNRSPPSERGRFSPPLPRNSSFPRAPNFQSATLGQSSSSASTRLTFSPQLPLQSRSMSASQTQINAGQLQALSPASRRSTVDQPSLSRNPRIQSTLPTDLHLPMLRSPFEDLGSSRSLSEASSRSFPAGVWEGREGEEILIEARLKHYQSNGPRSQSPTEMQQCRMRMFELVNNEFEIPTRRIAIQNRELEEECISYWIPFDDVHVAVSDQEVLISWSDCSHVNMKSKNYQTTFFCQYIPHHRNRQLKLEFENTDAPDLMQLSNYLLHPNLEKSQFEEISTSARNDSSESLKLYRRRADADYLQANANNPLDFAILVTFTVVNTTRCSVIYFGHLCLDFDFGVLQESVIFKNTFRLNYISTMEKASEKDLLRHLDLEGGPEKWEFRLEDMKLDLAGYNDFSVVTLMELLTDWQLLFKEEAISVVLKPQERLRRFSQSKRFNGALVSIWRRETETEIDLRLMARIIAPARSSHDIPWLSTSLNPSPVRLIVPEPSTIGLEDQAYLRGTKVAIDQMRVGEFHIEESKTQNIRFQFGTSASAINFYEAARNNN